MYNVVSPVSGIVRGGLAPRVHLSSLSNPFQPATWTLDHLRQTVPRYQNSGNQLEAPAEFYEMAAAPTTVLAAIEALELEDIG